MNILLKYSNRVQILRTQKFESLAEKDMTACARDANRRPFYQLSIVLLQPKIETYKLFR